MEASKMSTESVVLGLIITTTAIVGLIFNVKVMHVLYSRGFLSSKHNSIYIIAFVNIFNNTIQLVVSAVYLGPTSIMQKDYFEKGPESLWTKLFAWTFLGSWYCDMFFQPLTAINRFVMVVLPYYGGFFTRRNTIALSVGTMLFSYVLAFFSDFVIPCCIAYVYFGFYSYGYLQTGFNYVNYFVDWPINTSGSFISISLYIVIFIYVKRNNARAAKFNKDLMSTRKSKEVRYAVQFAFCSIFALCAWVTFRLFPLVVPSNKLTWFTFIALCVEAHSVANSLIFFCFNKEFKEKFFNKSGTSQSGIPTVSKHALHNPNQVGVSTGIVHSSAVLDA